MQIPVLKSHACEQKRLNVSTEHPPGTAVPMGTHDAVVVVLVVVVGVGGTQTPFWQVDPGTGQSAGVTQTHFWRPAASLGPHRCEQQLACSRQTEP